MTIPRSFALTAKAALTQRAAPWLDIDLIWQRSMAASAAAEALRHVPSLQTSNEIALSALM